MCQPRNHKSADLYSAAADSHPLGARVTDVESTLLRLPRPAQVFRPAAPPQPASPGYHGPPLINLMGDGAGGITLVTNDSLSPEPYHVAVRSRAAADDAPSSWA